MNPNNEKRYILVTRKTRLQELVERFNTWPQAKFYLEHNQVDAEDYLQEHDLYSRRLLQATQLLKTRGRFLHVERSFLPNVSFGPEDIIVAIGQDGLVANILKYLSGQPVIGINPDPERWDGKLLFFEIGDLDYIVQKTEKERAEVSNISFAEAITNDGQQIRAVNDLFIGPKSHTSARYNLRWNERCEMQSSSGIIVSTGFGSTGWFQSILAGALGITGNDEHELGDGFGWEEERLQFTVREPFPSRTTGVSMVFGEVTAEKRLVLESYMPENGVIFSDGIEEDYISFNSGCVVSIGLAPTKGVLISG